MASIDQLNFEVILNDKDFNDRINRDIDAANRLNTSLSSILNMKLTTKQIVSSAGVTNAKEMNKELDGITRKMQSLPTGTVLANSKDIENILRQILAHMEKMPSKAGKTRDATAGVNKELRTTVSFLRDIERLTGVAFGVIGVRRFVESLVDVTGQFEVQKMALQSMLQDADKADEIFDTLRKKALESPYTFQDLTKYAKQLTAFNIDADSLIETEQRLADVAAGLGVDVGRIILAYGQVKAAGVLKGTELRQFTEAGVPLLQSLAEQIQETEGHAISLAEVFQRITRKEIPFEMVEEAFKRMTSEGGKFYKMQEVLVQTLQGKMGKLRDVWQQALYDLGSANDGILKGSVDLLTMLASHLEDIGNILKVVIMTFGAYYSALLLAAAGQKVLAVATLVKEFIAMSRTLGIATASTIAFGSAAKAAAIGLGILAAAITTISILTKYIIDATNSTKEFEKSLKSIHEEARNDQSFSIEKEKVEALAKALNDSNRSYNERKAALDELKSIVPGYHADLTTEGNLIKNNTQAIDDYIAAKERSMKMDILEGELRQLLALQETAQESFNAASDAMDKINGASPAPGAVTPAGMTPLDVALAPRKLKNAETNLKRVGNEIDSVRTKMASLITGDANQIAEPTWTPIGKEEEVEDEWKVIDAMLDQVNKEMEKAYDENLKVLEDSLEKRKKAMEDFEAFLEDTSITKQEGTGIMFKLTGLMEDREKSDLATVRKYREELDNLKKSYKESGEAFKFNKEQLDAWLESTKAANLDKFNEGVKGLAKDIFEKGMEGYDLTDWADKTVAQIRAIKEAMKKVEVPDEIKSMLEEGTLDALVDALEDLVKQKIDKTVNPEFLKALGRAAKSFGKVVKDTLPSVKEYFDAIGNADLSATIDELTSFSELFSSVFQEASKGDFLGAVTAMVSWYAKTIFAARAEAKKFESALAAIREEARMARMEGALTAGVDSIFGTNDMRSVSNAIGVLDKARKSIASYVSDVGSMKFNGRKLGIFEWGAPNQKYKREDLESMAQAVGGDLYDAYNNLNADTLQAILNSYDNLTEAERLWLQTAIDDSEAYAAAMEQLEGVMESVFGSIADDAASAIVDGWIEAGNAALDYADILDNVAQTYAKMVIKSAILDTVLNDDAVKEVANAFTSGDYGKAMSLVEGDLAEIAAMEPLFNQILSTFDPYFQRESSSSSGSSDSLSSGIKSITENTANLLASYINAIRADVSSIKTMMENDNSITGETGAPNLNDYLAQIAATNFDIAQSSNAILSELRSVIGAPGTSGMVVRTEAY